MFFQNFIIFIIFLLIFNLNSYNCMLKDKVTVGEYLSEKIVAMERLINNADVKPREEMDITCTPDGFLNYSKLEKPRIIQTENYVFLMSGTEFSQIEIMESGEKKLKFIGNLDGIDDVNNIQDVHTGEWQSYIVVLVILPDHFIIYVTKLEFNEHPLQPRERIRLSNKPYIKILVNYNDTSNNDLTFILVNKLNNDLGEILQYKWRLTHFISDYRLLVQSMDETHIYQDHDNTIVMTTNYKQSSIEIYNNDNNSPSYYKKIQKIMMIENAINPKINYYSLNYNEHYFLLCYNKMYSLCKLYKYNNSMELFINIKKLPYNYQTLNKLYYNDNFANLLITTNVNHNKLVIFNNYNLFNYNLTECPNIADIREFIIYNNFNNITLIILNGEDRINFNNIQINKINNNYGDRNDSSGAGDNKQLLYRTINCFKNLKNLIRTKQAVIDEISVASRNVLQTNKRYKINKISGNNVSILANSKVNNISVEQNLEINLTDLFKTIIKINETRMNETRIKRAVAGIIKHLFVKSLSQTDFLLKHGNNKIKNNVFIKNNLVLDKQLYVNSSLINNINLTNLYLKSSAATPNGVHKLHDLKVFNNLIINSMNVNYLNNISAQNLFQGGENSSNNSNYNVIGSFGVENLIVENLNGVNWNEFYRNVYLNDSNRVIQGNLTFTAPFAVKTLNVKYLNNIPVNNYLNKITNQTINANIFINKFFANTIKAKTINNLEFNANKLCLLNSNATIIGDLQIANLKIRNNLFLSSMDASALLTPHHNTTKDLTQIYNKNVKITGNLFINKLYLENSNYSRIIVNNSEFNIKTVKSKYWLKNVKQTINKFIFNNDVITNQLFIENKLNDYNINKYCLNSFEQNLDYENNKFYFADLRVDGSINLNNTLNQRFLLNEINNNNILLNSDANKIINILDRKHINNLIVNKIHVNSINNYEIKQFVLNETNLRIPTLKIHKLNYFSNKKILVRNKLFINNYRDFFRNTIYINKNYNVGEMNFKNNLKINKLYCNDLALNQLYNNSVNYNLDNLKIVINGNVAFKQNLHVNRINSVANVKSYFDLLVFKNERNLQIGGKKTFWDRVTVRHNLLTEHRVNGINMNYLLGNLFLTNTEQLIHPIWSFNNIRTDYLKSRYVNDISTKLFLSQNDYLDSDRELVINSNIMINNLTVKARIYGNTKLNLPNIIEALHRPARGAWQFIRINKDLRYPNTKNGSKLYELLHNSVVRNKNQIITNEIIFSESVQIKNLEFNHLINGAINLNTIINDSLVRNGNNATVKVYASKYFKNNLFVKDDFVSRNDLNCNYINNINIVDLHNNLTQFGDIRSIKQFKNYLTINKLFVNNELVNYNKKIDEMVVVDGTKRNNIIINLNDFEVGQNFNFIEINNFNISDFLENRIKLDSTEVQTINSLNITGGLIVTSVCNINTINSVNMSDLVYKDEPAVVTGKKVFLNNVTFNTTVDIKNINDIDIRAIHNHTIFLNQPETIREILLPEVVVRSGVLLTNEDQLILPSQNLDSFTDKFKTNLTNLSTNVAAIKELKYSKKLNYFDYTNNFDIIISNNNDNSNSNILIDSYDNGGHCDLNDYCQCPFQYLVDVKNFNKILINKKRYFERNFNLRNRFIRVTVVTKYETVPDCHHYEYNNVTTIEFVNVMSNDKKMYRDNKIIKTVKLFEYGKTLSEINNFMVILYTSTNYDSYMINLIEIPNNNFDDIKLQQNSTINGHDVNMNLFNWNIGIVLITTTIYHINYYNNGFVELYLFNKNEHRFDLVQTLVGHYDLINGAIGQIDDSYMLVLAKRDTNYINVYKLNSNYRAIRFEMYQKIMFEKKVKSITVFENLENTLFGVTMENDHYHIYIYNYIEGWIVHSTGYYNKVEQIEPFKIQDKDYLFINGRLAPTAVAIYTQGN